MLVYYFIISHFADLSKGAVMACLIRWLI